MALNQNAPTVFPTLRYDDAHSAIKFLTHAFGLVAGEIVNDDRGRVAHAVLGWHHGLIMISSRRDEPSPFDTGRAVLYLASEDPDAVHDRAVAAGAEIVMGLVDQEYGSREFAARDPEGNVWCFGTYQPAALEPATP
jgi:uncharacterized glyoxalase superfamily protein PhnB